MIFMLSYLINSGSTVTVDRGTGAGDTDTTLALQSSTSTVHQYTAGPIDGVSSLLLADLV